MKKTLKFIFVGLSCALILGFTSCGATTPTTGVSPNWHKNTNLSTNIAGTYEELKYSVTFKKGTNEHYAVTYEKGEYGVTLQNADKNGELVYKLTSTLNIKGKYTLGTQEKAFIDSVESECYFRSAGSRLTPISSKKIVHSTSPRANKPTTMDEAVTTYDYTVEITYAPDGKTAKSVYTDTSNASNPQIKNKDYNLTTNLLLIDNESLLFAVRGFNLTDTAVNVSIVNPYAQKQETVSITKTAEAQGEYSFQEKDKNETEKVKKKITVSGVQIKRNDNFAGKVIAANYAVVSKEQNYRAVMLKMENPLSYNLGTLVYDLEYADFTEQ